MLYVSLLSTRFLWCIFKKKISCEYGREKKLQVIGLLNLIFGWSSHSNVVYKKYFFKNLATFIRKRLSWRLFFNKVVDWRLCKCCKWWTIYTFTLILIYKTLNFCYAFRNLSCFCMIKCDCYNRLKAFFIFFIEKLYCCLFVFYPVTRIYMWSNTIEIYLIPFILQ